MKIKEMETIRETLLVCLDEVTDLNDFLIDKCSERLNPYIEERKKLFKCVQKSIEYITKEIAKTECRAEDAEPYQ